jgi:hypothetical protein
MEVGSVAVTVSGDPGASGGPVRPAALVGLASAVIVA